MTFCVSDYGNLNVIILFILKIRFPKNGVDYYRYISKVEEYRAYIK